MGGAGGGGGGFDPGAFGGFGGGGEGGGTRFFFDGQEFRGGPPVRVCVLESCTIDHEMKNNSGRIIN